MKPFLLTVARPKQKDTHTKKDLLFKAHIYYEKVPTRPDLLAAACDLI